MQGLNNIDYDNILEFSFEILNNEENFRHRVLDLLSEMYKFNHTTFLLADKNDNLKNPIGINISNDLLLTYNSYYYKTDIFLQKQINNSKKELLLISDIMTYPEYEKTEYYNDFLKKDDLYYQIAIPLMTKGNLIGGLGIFREKGEGDFTQKELMILKYISKIVSLNLNSLLHMNQIEQENRLYRNTIKSSPIGHLILNSRYDIMNCSEIAEDICCKITGNNNRDKALQEVIKKIFSQLSRYSLNYHSNLILDMGLYTFEITPVINQNVYNEIEIYLSIHMSKKRDDLIDKYNRFKEKYKLTKREIEIVHLITKGLTNKEIAQKLFISNHTVKTHIENIFKKVEIKNRTIIIEKLSEI